MASARVSQRAAEALPAEEIMVVSITDGEENASHEFSLPIIRQLIQAHSAAGWSFVFLGAALDVYGEASQMGIDHRSTQSFVADGAGAEIAFDSLSKATLLRREKIRAFESFDKADFFENQNPAEQDRNSRQGN